MYERLGLLSSAQIFEKIEAAKGILNLEDYAISQTTLEQVPVHALIPLITSRIKTGIKEIGERNTPLFVTKGVH